MPTHHHESHLKCSVIFTTNNSNLNYISSQCSIYMLIFLTGKTESIRTPLPLFIPPKTNLSGIEVMEKVKHTIVLYPSPGMGHIISMVELGKLITKHHPSFSITILVTTPPFNTGSGSTAPYLNHVSKTSPHITFYHLPTIPISAIPTTTSPHHETVMFELLHLNNPHVHQALQTISSTSTTTIFIIDMFCHSSMKIADQLNIPVFYFFTSGVSFLSVLLYFPTVHKNTTKSFKDLNMLLDFPGMPPVLSTDMCKPMLDRTDKVYEGCLDSAIQISKARGIMVNTFESLEPRALKAVSDGLSVPDAPTPPVYCIGPLIASDDRSGGASGGDRSCLEWLDLQPPRSVVFLCFGSLGLFSQSQLKEIATGIENSGQRFLWVVRSPPTQDESKRFLPPQDPDLDALLPDGFLDRTKDRGLVVKTWAPQVEVLSRESVGGFVTHCGWNSVLEAVCAGIPMMAWPLYAEQRINKIVLVEELKLALPMKENGDGFVLASEVEKRVRELMVSDEGKTIRERVVKLSEEAKEAMSQGGSSTRALANLAELWKK